MQCLIATNPDGGDRGLREPVAGRVSGFAELPPVGFKKHHRYVGPLGVLIVISSWHTVACSQGTS